MVGPAAGPLTVSVQLAEPVDCRSQEGVTVGLIDGIIAVARFLRGRDLSHPAVREALADLAEDEDVAGLLRVHN